MGFKRGWIFIAAQNAPIRKTPWKAIRVVVIKLVMVKTTD